MFGFRGSHVDMSFDRRVSARKMHGGFLEIRPLVLYDKHDEGATEYIPINEVYLLYSL